MKLVRFESVRELRDHASLWDDLWRRSEVTLPTARAELVAQWIEQFASGRRFVTLAVEAGGQWVAALPLIAARGFAGRWIALLPRNSWTDAADFLLDPHAPNEACELLAQGLRRLPFAVACADGVAVESPRWRRLLTAVGERGTRIALRPKFQVGVIDIGGDWNAYEASWSRNHRHAVRKSRRRLEEMYPIELVRRGDPSPDEAVSLLQTVCEVEDKSWKGDSGSSILRTPGMLSFFQRQARQLALWGQLEVTLLRQNGETLAAEYAYVGKDVIHSHKIAYDARFREFGPFRMLRYLQLQELFTNRHYRKLDTLGILSDANAKWSTRSYPLTRVVFGCGAVAGNGLVDCYDRLWPTLKRWLGRVDPPMPLPEKLGAAEYWAQLSREEQASATSTLQPTSPC